VRQGDFLCGEIETKVCVGETFHGVRRDGSLPRTSRFRTPNDGAADTGRSGRRVIAGRLIVAAALAAVAALTNVPLQGGSLLGVDFTAISPGLRIRITGTGFEARASRNLVTFTPVSGSPVTMPGQTLTSDGTTQRLLVDIPATLPIGSTAVSVRNMTTGEESTGLSIEIVSLTLSGVTSAPPGATVAVTIDTVGAMPLDPKYTAVSFGTGITVQAWKVVSPTRIDATLVVSPAAALGSRLVDVRTGTAAAHTRKASATAPRLSLAQPPRTAMPPPGATPERSQ
jgi:hypothetical protein